MTLQESRGTETAPHEAGIVVRGLGKRFGSFQAVHDVTFDARDGRITALLGPSGSGKSTVLRIIAGLERQDEGTVTMAGEDHTHASVQERRVGFVFQHYALFRHMTVRQNIGFGLAVRKRPKAEITERVDELLELVQLAPFAERYPHNLSGGQRQRVALARALAPRPKVLLLDEPFGALDARVRQELRHWLDELHRELGVTSLLVTHDQEEALELADRVVLMHQGKVEQIGAPDDVYNRPATPFVAGFVGAANVLHGTVRGGRLSFGEHASWDAAYLGDGSDAAAYVRPHDVRVLGTPGGRESVPAVLERTNNLGWMSKVHLTLADGQRVVAHVPNGNLGALGPGDRVWLDLRDAKVFGSDQEAEAAAAVAG